MRGTQRPAQIDRPLTLSSAVHRTRPYHRVRFAAICTDGSSSARASQPGEPFYGPYAPRPVGQFLSLLALAALPATSSGGTFTWKAAAGGSFQDATSWSNISPPGPPGPADTALFDLNSAYAVTFTGNATNTGYTQSQGTVTFAIGGGQTYQVTGTNGFTVGNTFVKAASLTIINGIVNVTGNNGGGSTPGGIGAVGASTGSVTVTGPAAVFNASNLCDIGVNGVGTLTVQNFASATLGGGSSLGTNGSGTGTVTVTGSGTFSAPAGLLVGQSGVGNLSVTGTGSATVIGLAVGNVAGSLGTVGVGNGDGKRDTDGQ